jgi:hypothetical protein
MIAQSVGGPLHAFARLREKKSFAYSAGKKPQQGEAREALRAEVEFLIDSPSVLNRAVHSTCELEENARGGRMGRNDNPTSYRECD